MAHHQGMRYLPIDLLKRGLVLQNLQNDTFSQKENLAYVLFGWLHRLLTYCHSGDNASGPVLTVVSECILLFTLLH